MRAQRLILALLLAAPSIGAAQAADATRSLSFTLDNDFLALRGAGAPPDYDYTHGARIAVDFLGAPDLVRRLLFAKRACGMAGTRQSGCLATGFELGQRIYTPRHDAAEPVAGERPYAGWLYLAGKARVLSPGSVFTADVEIGVTGKGSLAEPVQKRVHELFRNEEQLGWPHQIPTDPRLIWRMMGAHRFDRPINDGLVPAATVRWGVTQGDVIQALSLGADATLDIGERVPWSLSEPEIERPGRFYVLAGYRQDAVFRNIFVEGLAPGAFAERRKFVGQFEGGIGYRRPTFRIEYRHIVRGREYDTQPTSHAWGSLGFAFQRF